MAARRPGTARIARIWRGVTPRSKADSYFAYLKKTGVPGYRAVKGNLGVFVFRRIQGDRAEFLLPTLWDSMHAIRAFAGPDPDRTMYYPADDDFLLEREATVDHYDVLLPG